MILNLLRVKDLRAGSANFNRPFIYDHFPESPESQVFS